MIKPCIGIPSWLPDEKEARNERIGRLNGLIKQLENLFNLPIIFIAQNWKDYSPSYKGVLHIYHNGKLGILKARKLLREKFLKSDYDYLIMLDDDAILQGDPANYLRGLEEHPDGFTFREDAKGEPLPSQLNLFAISKSLYKKEDMVNVDPQKDEGFEDDIFTHLLMYKYPQLRWHFTDLYDVHFKNPEIDKLGGEVKSTWAKDGHNWLRLRENTKFFIRCLKEGNYNIENIRDQLCLNKSDDEIPFPIDYVFPYVNNNEAVWQKSFKDYCVRSNNTEKLKSLKGERYDDMGLLPILIQSIEQNLPWIRKIHVIVSNPEQFPEALKHDKVHVVLHKDIIPPKYLPTFNSTTIEMYLRRIPDLAEHFIYGNDDIFILNKMSPSYFFTRDGKVKVNMETRRREDANQFARVCYNNYREVLDYLKINKSATSFERPYHGITPMVKSHCWECIDALGSKIFTSDITPFRNNKQHNQYIYPLWEKYKYGIDGTPLYFKYVSMIDSLEKICDAIKDQGNDVLCLNDCQSKNRGYIIKHMDEIRECFKGRLK